jgi:3',5'-cyclic AMP phosphodiesterase CpdA
MGSPLVLFHVSDLHFGYEDRAALAWFLAEVERERPAAVLCTGDLTMRGTAREYAMARAWLAQLPVPLTLEPGNHDVPYYWYPLARAFHPWRHYRALEAAVERAPALPDLAVVPLRTVAAAQWRLNWSKGRVGPADLDASLADLERQRGKGLRLVTCHHPLVDADTESTGSTRGGKRALAALARAGAQAVLSGHVHDAFDLELEADGLPIRLIGAGTLSRRLRRTAPSYNRLEWNEAGGLAVGRRNFD